jgi:hypothetical protein
MSKLHGVRRSCVQGIIINAGKAVVANPTGPAVTLRDNPRGGDPHIRKILLSSFIWEDYPLALMDHVNEFFF